MASAAKAEEDEDPYLVDFDEFQSTDQSKSSGGGGGMSIKVPEAFHRADILEDSLENSQHVSAPLSLPAQSAAVRDAMRCHVPPGDPDLGPNPGRGSGPGSPFQRRVSRGRVAVAHRADKLQRGESMYVCMYVCAMPPRLASRHAMHAPPGGRGQHMRQSGAAEDRHRQRQLHRICRLG